jgi:hypothetical protein
MITPEQSLYQWMQRGLPKSIDCHRIENCAGSGMPDVNMCYEGFEIWVELKVLPLNMILLRPAQYAWGMRRGTAGGSVFIVNAHEDGLLSIWTYPHVTCTPYGKYARIVNTVDEGPFIIDRSMRFLLKFLFPACLFPDVKS